MPQAPKEEDIASTKGARIRVRSWRPAGGPRAVMVICPGFNAYGGLYGWSAAQFSASGFSVFAVDLRGRGNSSGARFYVEDIADYVSDLAAVVKLAKSREPGLPVFLLGHSAGGVTACVYALDNQDELAGLICESFAFRVPAPDFAIAIIKGLSHVAPRLPLLKLKNKDFTRDPKALAALDGDPLVANETQPALTIAALARADDRLTKEFPRITLPVLILHGTADKATLPSGSQFFYDTAGSTDKTIKLYEGHYHDLLNDLGKEEVMADIKAWIGKRIPA
jgi:alpha-beta hydrolase superfamily lysophospholipase